jgi:hypothetical protein
LAGVAGPAAGVDGAAAAGLRESVRLPGAVGGAGAAGGEGAAGVRAADGAAAAGGSGSGGGSGFGSCVGCGSEVAGLRDSRARPASGVLSIVGGGDSPSSAGRRATLGADAGGAGESSASCGPSTIRAPRPCWEPPRASRRWIWRCLTSSGLGLMTSGPEAGESAWASALSGLPKTHS